MSFYDDASLVFLPSGQAGKDGKAYSMKPTDGSGDFTFSRGSNLTATRIDSNGLIEKGRENLVLQSNQFDTTWLTTNASVTSGQSGYDGSSDAWLLSKSAAGGNIRQNVTSSGVNTYSVYAKSGTINWLRFRLLDSSNHISAFFDLQNGEVGLTEGNNYIDSSVESIGGGWYRCSVTFSAGTSQVRIFPADGDNDTSGTSGSIYIQDAQLEQGLVATEYIESGATTGLAGILEDSPRFDYSGGASCPSLLLEPSRTNLIEYSEYLVSINAGSVEYNSSTSPEGLQNATKVIFGAIVNDGATMNLSASCSGNTQYTWSAYVKNISGTGLFNIRIDTDTTTILVNQDITATSEWTRVSHTFTTDASATSFGSNSRYRSKADGNEILIWGAQLEEGSYPTSYIPNHSGGSVTRELDHCFTSSNSVLEEINATYFLEVTPIQIASNNLLEVRANGSINNRILLQTSSLGVLRVLVRAQGSSVLDQNISGAVSANTKVKIALKYTDRTNISVFVDGVKEIDSDLVIDFSPELNGLDLEGSATANNDSLKQHQFIFFPTALSDANCITLTS